MTELQTAEARLCRQLWTRAAALKQFAATLPASEACVALRDAEADAARARLLMMRLGLIK